MKSQPHHRTLLPLAALQGAVGSSLLRIGGAARVRLGLLLGSQRMDTGCTSSIPYWSSAAYARQAA